MKNDILVSNAQIRELKMDEIEQVQGGNAFLKGIISGVASWATQQGLNNYRSSYASHHRSNMQWS